MSSAGTVPLGGAANVGASKLTTGDPNMARRAMDGSICGCSSAYWGCAGAGHWYCSNLNLSRLLDMSDPDLIKVHRVHANKVHIVQVYKVHIVQVNKVHDFNTDSCKFIEVEVAFYTTLSCECTCIWEINLPMAIMASMYTKMVQILQYH